MPPIAGEQPEPNPSDYQETLPPVTESGPPEPKPQVTERSSAEPAPVPDESLPPLVSFDEPRGTAAVITGYGFDEAAGSVDLTLADGSGPTDTWTLSCPSNDVSTPVTITSQNRGDSWPAYNTGLCADGINRADRDKIILNQLIPFE